MTFTEILNETAQAVEGAVAVSLVGLDGIGVETVAAGGEDFDAEAAEVEIAGLVGNIWRTLGTLSSGEVKEVIIEAATHSYFISLVDNNYFILLTLGPAGNLGRARYEVRKAAQKLRSNL